LAQRLEEMGRNGDLTGVNKALASLEVEIEHLTSTLTTLDLPAPEPRS
jgi:hypothetical protein